MPYVLADNASPVLVNDWWALNEVWVEYLTRYCRDAAQGLVEVVKQNPPEDSTTLVDIAVGCILMHGEFNYVHRANLEMAAKALWADELFSPDFYKAGEQQ